MPRKHIKYGATGFNAKVSPSKINQFIAGLPGTKRQSMYQVAEELKSAGLIETTGENTPFHRTRAAGRQPVRPTHKANSNLLH